MLEIQLIMNSPVEDIFGFKTCCGAKTFDQNLEIILRNRGGRAVVVPSRFRLIGDGGSRLVDTLMPFGDLRIEPGEIKAFYCMMDEEEWRTARQVVFQDTEGRSYSADILHPQKRGK